MMNVMNLAGAWQLVGAWLEPTGLEAQPQTSCVSDIPVGPAYRVGRIQ